MKTCILGKLCLRDSMSHDYLVSPIPYRIIEVLPRSVKILPLHKSNGTPLNPNDLKHVEDYSRIIRTTSLKFVFDSLDDHNYKELQKLNYEYNEIFQEYEKSKQQKKLEFDRYLKNL